MEINCLDNSFRDVSVGTNEFNECTKNDTKWENPNGGKLISAVIDQVCVLVNQSDESQ